MANFSGPYSRKVEYLDKIADILRGEDDLIHNVGDREIFALQRLAEFIEGEGSGKYKNVQSDWNAEPDSQAAILNKPDGIPVDPNYVHTDENFTAQHRNKLENIEEMAQHNVQADWGETDTESDAYIKNVPDDIVQDGNYVHTDFNFDEHYKDMLDYHVITDDMYTSEDAEKLANIEEYATHTDIDGEITENSTNPVQSRVIFAALETKVDKEEGYGLSKNDLTDELKAKLDAIEPEANKTIVDDALSDESTNPVENRVVQAALDTKVDKVEGQGLSDQNFTRTEKLKLEAIEEQANRTIPDKSITANSRNVVESRAIYEALETKVDKVSGKGLSANDYTDQEKNKLAGIEDNANNTIVDPQVSNVSQNPVTSKAIYDELQKKVDKVEGKALSDNNYTDEEKIKLGRLNPDAPKITICRLITGDPPALNMTWQECKDAISNGILYYQKTTGNSETLGFCYSVESEYVNGNLVYRAEFAGLNEEFYEFYETSSATGNPALVSTTHFQHGMEDKADKATTVNGHTLDQDVEITPNDISYAHTTEFDAGTVGFALNHLRSTKADKATAVNGHSLEDDVVVTASDIAFDREDPYGEGSIGKQVKDLAEKADELQDDVDNMMIISDTQPTEENNKLWAKENPDGAVQIATYEELQALEAIVNGKVDAEPGKTLTTNDYTSTEKSKLAGIAAGAQVNVLETVKVNGTALTSDGHKAVNVIVPTKLTDLQNDDHYVTDADYVHTDNNYTTAEKEKLGGIEEGSQVNVIETVKVNGTAQAVSEKEVDLFVPTRTSEIANDSDFISHADLSDANPQMDGTASSGSSQDFARSDHVHPTDSTRAPLESPALTGTPTAPTAAKGTDTAQLATTAFVQTAISDKANADDVYTKAQVDNKLTSMYRLKGAKDEITDLPTEGNSTGDVWHVNADTYEYFWNGSDWEPFGKIVDLTGYVYDPSYVHTDNNLTSELKTKLENIEAGAQVNVNADWDAENGDAQILHKPMINNVELVGGNNTLESLGIVLATEQNIDDLFN